MKAILRGFQVFEMLDDEIDELIVVEMSGGGYDDVAGGKALGIGFADGVALELFHRFFRAQDGFAQRMIFPEVLGEDFVDEVIGIVLIHFNFFENDAALASDIFRGECGMQNQVSENLKSYGNIFVQNFDVEADTFFGGEGIHVAADGVDLAGDLFGGAVLGAFEDHVLDKMGDAIGLRRLVARTGFEPDADRGRADVLHLLGDNSQTVRENLTANIANFLYHDEILSSFFWGRVVRQIPLRLYI